MIYDSEIEILHMPESNHKDRDLAAFERLVREGKRLDRRLHGIYARELFVSGDEKDFRRARDFFRESCQDSGRSV